MSTASIAHQIARCLDQLFLTKAEIESMKQDLGVASLKRALRPGGDPTRPIPYILSYETYRSYFRIGRTFFQRAQRDTGERLLYKLLTTEVIMAVHDKYYAQLAPKTISQAQLAIKKIHAGATVLGWARGPCPIENEFRDLLQVHYTPPRYGYHPRDAQRILDYLVEKNSSCALAAKIALYCGLRKSEVAGLMGENVDRLRRKLCFKGKNGRYREVPIPEKLLPELTRRTGYFFTPSRSWRGYFLQEVSAAARALGIEDTGVHRLRATYAQGIYTQCRMAGGDDSSARQEVAHLLGHGRRAVTFHYVPECFDWTAYTEYVDPGEVAQNDLRLQAGE